MAEIKIEKKKPIWPWVVLIVVLIVIALLYFLVFAKQDDDADNSNYNDTEQIDEIDSTSNAAEDTAGWQDNQMSDSLTGGSTEMTSAYLSSIDDKSKLGKDAAYTNNALVRLTDAVRAKANENQLDLDTDLKQARDNIMKTNVDSVNISSEKIKEVGNKIVTALQNIQKESYPQLTEEVKAVKNKVDDIDSKKNMDKQQDQIKAFFNKSSAVLQQMD